MKEFYVVLEVTYEMTFTVPAKSGSAARRKFARALAAGEEREFHHEVSDVGTETITDVYEVYLAFRRRRE